MKKPNLNTLYGMVATIDLTECAGLYRQELEGRIRQCALANRCAPEDLTVRQLHQCADSARAYCNSLLAGAMA